jgi:hypothetical protein
MTTEQQTARNEQMEAVRAMEDASRRFHAAATSHIDWAAAVVARAEAELQAANKKCRRLGIAENQMDVPYYL